MAKKIMCGLVVALAMVMSLQNISFAQDQSPKWVGEARSATDDPLEIKIKASNLVVVENWIHGYIEVTGKATAPRGNDVENAKINAEDAARTLAYAKLSEWINGVWVELMSIVRDSGSQGNIARRVLPRHLIKNAIVLEEKSYEADNRSIVGIVKMGYLLNGRKGLSGFMVDNGVPQEEAESDKLFVPSSSTPKPAETYTGLIVDASGIGVTPGLFPKILAEGDGRVVYSAKVTRDPDVLVNGSVRYARSIENAKEIKNHGGKLFFGNNPLVVRGVRAVNRSSIVVSDEDALKIYAADLKSKFLRDAKVGFALK